MNQISSTFFFNWNQLKKFVHVVFDADSRKKPTKPSFQKIYKRKSRKRDKHLFLKQAMIRVLQLCIYNGLLNYFICQRNFPLNELYNIPPSEYVFSFGILCDGSTFDKSCCECHDDCLRFKTCCIDKLWNSSNPIPIQEYLEVLVNETSKFKDTTCESVFPLVPDSKTVQMVSTCVNDAEQADIDGCLNKKSLFYGYNIPVLGSDNYLYKNSFCARCNSIENFEFVNLTAKCVSSTLESYPFGYAWENETRTAAAETTKVKRNLYQNLETCFFDIAKSNRTLDIKYCSPQDDYNRNIGCRKPNENYKLCLSYYGYGNALGQKFANYHCYLCNSTNLDQARNNKFDFFCPLKYKPGKGEQLQWSFTLSFSSQTSLGVTGPGYSESDNFCQDREFYNIITSKCEMFSCSSGYERVGNTCHKLKISNVINIENATFDRCLIRDEVSLIYQMNTLLANKTLPKNEIENVLNISLSSSFQHLFTSGNVTFSQSILFITKTTLERIYNILTRPDITLWKTVSVLYISAITKHTPTMLYGVDPKHSFPGGRLCADPVIEVNPKGNFTDTCSYQIDHVNISYMDLSLFLRIQPGQVRRTVSVCSNYYLHSACRLREIVSNYTVMKNLSLITENKYYNSSQYVPTKGGISVCLEELKKGYKWYQSVLNAQKFISVIGTSISILAYIAIILFYAFMKELTNLSSKTIVALCATLLFADITFLVATQQLNNKLACKVIAIILHWALLAAQVWTAVIAFDLLTRFGSVTLTLRKKSCIRFCQYCLVAYLVPSIILALTVTLNETLIYDIGYEKRNTCFIYNFYPKLYFYIIPFAIAFVSTVVCFIFTIFFIWKHEDKIQKSLKDSGRKNRGITCIALKLIVALGIIEVVGLIQISKSSFSENELVFNSVFAVTYTILRSFRGVILCFIYGKSKENIKKLKTVMRKIKVMRTSRTTEIRHENTASTKL